MSSHDRAGPPAEGCGSRKLFRCAYHGWTYGLDGCLVNAPEFDGVLGFDADQFSLAPIRVEEWFNLVFVNLDPDAPSLNQSLGSMKVQAEKFDFSSMKLFERRTYDMKCNWKTYIDNYLEGYHLPSVHPALNPSRVRRSRTAAAQFSAESTRVMASPSSRRMAGRSRG